jgi:ribosome-binding protein aMBF1 (putative translation factor)
MYANNHQDWKTIVFNKKEKDEGKRKDEGKNSKSNETISSTTGTPMWKLEKQIDDENGKGKVLQCIDKNTSKQIIESRMKLKLTQKDLAQKLNIPVNIIKEIEGGTFINNKAIIGKINGYFKNNNV